MSKLSIYESTWIDLVFENRNKEYGAYQLRNENSKTAFTAFFMGVVFVASIVSTVLFVSKIKTSSYTETSTIPVIDEVIQLTNVSFKPKETLPLPALPVQNVIPLTSLIEKSQLTNLVIAKGDVAVPEIAKNSESVIPVYQNSTGIGVANNTMTSLITGNDKQAIGNQDSDTAIINSGVLDVMPAFPGGIEKFYKYVGNNFRQPELDLDKIFKIYVSFVIEKDGSMTDIKVVRDPGFGLGKEAIRVLQSLKTKWSPGIIASKPVRTAYNLPITIKAE